MNEFVVVYIKRKELLKLIWMYIAEEKCFRRNLRDERISWMWMKQFLMDIKEDINERKKYGSSPL